MNEKDLNVFIEGIQNYYAQISDSPAVVQTPYLLENSNTLAYEYTGIIGISGKNKGCVYFTAPEKLLKQTLLVIKETDTSHDNICDLVGEIANTVAGNARGYFGSEFMISVPIVITRQKGEIKLPKDVRSFIVPITWRSHESAIVISIDTN